MQQSGIKNPSADLSKLGLKNIRAYWNLPVPELVERSIAMGEGVLADSGALVIKTGEFTGRSPKDRFIVKDDSTVQTICSKLHRDFVRKFRFARVKGPSAKFDWQRVGLDHLLKDGYILTFVVKR